MTANDNRKIRAPGLAVTKETEITPEMTDAGAEVILGAYGGLDLVPCPSIVADRVFQAMFQISLASRRKARRRNPSRHDGYF